MRARTAEQLPVGTRVFGRSAFGGKTAPFQPIASGIEAGINMIVRLPVTCNRRRVAIGLVGPFVRIFDESTVRTQRCKTVLRFVHERQRAFFTDRARSEYRGTRAF